MDRRNYDAELSLSIFGSSRFIAERPWPGINGAYRNRVARTDGPSGYHAKSLASSISTTASSYKDRRGVCIDEYRSPRARDYKKIVVSRPSAVVHNEYARGYDQNAPTPSYANVHERQSDRLPWECDARISAHVEAEQKNVEGERSVAMSLVSTRKPFPEAASSHTSNRNHLSQVTITSGPEKHYGKLPTTEGKHEDKGLTRSPIPQSNYSYVSTPSNTSDHSPEDSLTDNKRSYRTAAKAAAPLHRSSQSLRSQTDPLVPFKKEKSRFSRSDPQEETANSPLSLLREPLSNAILPCILTVIKRHEHGDVLAANSPRRPLPLLSCPGPPANLVRKASSAVGNFTSGTQSHNSFDSSPIDHGDRWSQLRGHFYQSHVTNRSGAHDWASESSCNSERDSESALTFASSIPSIPSPEVLASPDPGGGVGILPCEFSGYSSCNKWFDADDTQTWAEHVINDHLHNNIPSTCCCWFCDDVVFDAGKADVDRYTNFLWRMEHIRGHFVEDGCTVKHIRIDCHFLDHVWQNGLITETVFEAARDWTEGPVSRVSGLYDYDFEPFDLLRLRENFEWLTTDQRKEDRQMIKDGYHDIVFRPRVPRLRSFRRESQPLDPIGDHTRESQDTASLANLRPSFNSSKKYAEAGTSLVRSLPYRSRKSCEEVGHLASIDNDIVQETTDTVSVSKTTEVHIAVDEDFSNNLKPTETPISSISLHSVANFIVSNPRLSSEARVPVLRLLDSSQSRPQLSHCGAGDHTDTQGNISQSNAEYCGGESRNAKSSEKSQEPSRPRKKRKIGQPPDEEGSGDEDVQPSSFKGKEKEPNPLFACPFYKHDVLRYRDQRYCNGPGWPNVRRVKEHLIRAHKPIQCHRCGATFKEPEVLTAHHQEEVACDRRKDFKIEGLNSFQEEKLRSRTVYNKKSDECGKWRSMYAILFPHQEIPSPFYEPMEVYDALMNTTEHKTHVLESFKPYLTNAFRQKVRTSNGVIDLVEAEELLEGAMHEAFNDWIRNASITEPQPSGAIHANRIADVSIGEECQLANEQTVPSMPGSTSGMESIDLRLDSFISSYFDSSEQHMDSSTPAFPMDSFQFLEPLDPGISQTFPLYPSQANDGPQQPAAGGSDSGYGGSNSSQDNQMWLRTGGQNSKEDV